MQNKDMVVSFVYASNNAQEWKQLWSYLVAVSGSFENVPRIIIGDFNVLLSLTESSKYDGSQVSTQDMRDFYDCLAEVEVTDHIFFRTSFY